MCWIIVQFNVFKHIHSRLKDWKIIQNGVYIVFLVDFLLARWSVGHPLVDLWHVHDLVAKSRQQGIVAHESDPLLLANFDQAVKEVGKQWVGRGNQGDEQTRQCDVSAGQKQKSGTI